ncbi:MAG: HAMP domain-containing sensor histidine kinase [Lachnospiraceae bacterium]|nr:HAMP domain-containing sensor histidine kinase [Lachnospiraceae bacterium]
MLKKLRIKFICFNMTIVTVMLIVIFSLVFGITRRNLETQSLQMMQAADITPTRPAGRPEDLSPHVKLPYFTVQINEQGELTANGGGYYDLSDKDFLWELADTALASENPVGTIREYNLRFCRIKTPFSQCLVFSDISNELATLRNLLKTCLFIGLISFAVFLVISIFLAKWAVAPVEHAWSQQRQFVADASHELKTPLTVILTNAEMLQSADYGEAARRQFSDNILTMSRQMRGLVESLLELARVDNGSVAASQTALDFSVLVENALLPFEPIYFEKNLTLKSQLENNIRIRASEPHMQQLIGILLDNAQKYSDPSSEITVCLKKQGKRHCILSVENPGPAISPDDLKHIFKRFYRIDKARSMNQSYGLGLSIAESIVSCHHGKIWCESKNGRNTFFVRLPSII